MVKNKRTCFLDEYIKMKQSIPIANLDMSGDLLNKKGKSPLPKASRDTLPI